ncbi:cobalamin biosynthesis protein CobW [Methylopila jiangsuensis]|uniref:Cobalamin biosynthesis protein CobW n=1 Tax=Methylopila jiangsuensis TaxID=586230 RepID=A0A9W6N5B7_9HYPH|nr:GTP-binding protein [Methylopila jiangsuensis]MDR6284526.1 G3E family GTPase [Methylopila jiangsuensis]GLK78086.1 cobalamin biosynthesis protein CobW [Methylopila jiangsuensis]
MPDPRRPEPLPLVLLTGFLGAGKTTLLNRLLRDPALANAAVLVNELGEIGVDHLLVEHAEEGVIALAGGCLCCGVRGELVDALENLLRARDNGRLPPFDRLVIETTGLADPAPALQTLMLHPYLALRFHLAAVVTVVDASDGGATLLASPEAARQAAMADRIVLSKTDLATPEQFAATRAAVARLAPTAEVASATEADAAALLAPAEGPRRGLDAAPLGHGAVRAVSMESEAPLTRAAYDLFVELLRSAHAAKLLRLKGLVRLVEEPDRPLLVQGVRHVFAEPRVLDAWPDDDRRTRLVAIGEGLEPGLLAGLYAAFAGQVAPDRPDRAALTENPLAPRSGGLLG